MNLKLRITHDLKKIMGEDVPKEQLEVVDDYFYSILKPKIFWGSNGVSVQYDKSFEAACFVISQSSSRDPKQMVVKEYMQTLEELRNQSKAHADIMAKNKRGK